MIFALFSILNFSLVIIAFSKNILFFGVIAGLALIVLGMLTISEGISYTTSQTIAQSWLQQTVGNATVYNTTSSIVSGFTNVVITFNDIGTAFIGLYYFIIGLGSMSLSMVYGLRGSKAEGESE